MSDQFNRGGKNDGSRKYQSINLSQHFNKRDPKAAAKSTTGRGLQSLGKVGVSTRRLPRPAVCSSLKKENAGNDPNVALVPGGGGWGSKKEAAQVELGEGEKGWKDVEEKSTVKHPGFSQEFPSLGEDAPSTEQRLELRPHTGKWGEKQRNTDGEPVPQMAAIPQTFGVVQVPMSPMYGVVPVPGPVYSGGAVYRPVYPAQPLFTGNNNNPGILPIPYMYTAPPPFHSPAEDETEKVVESAGEKIEETSKGDTSAVGYISPYTLPFPGKMKAEESPSAEPPAPGKEDKRVMYHGRTSSHSSLSEPPEEEEEQKELQELAAPTHHSGSQSRVISRSLAKKELKAFPRDDEGEKSQKEDVSQSWEEETPETSTGSVWEERQVWKVEQPNESYFDEDYVAPPPPPPAPEAKEEEPPHRFMDTAQRKAIEAASNYMNNTYPAKKQVEILRKEGSKPPSSNYWAEKQAERDRIEAEEEAKKRERLKAEALRARQHQYQDYRTPDQYNQSALDEEEEERRSIRRRGQHEFYDQEPRRADRRPRRAREEVFQVDRRREPPRNREHRRQDSRDLLESRESSESRENKSESRDTRRRSRDQQRYDARDDSRPEQHKNNRYDRFSEPRSRKQDRPKRQPKVQPAEPEKTEEIAPPQTPEESTVPEEIPPQPEESAQVPSEKPPPKEKRESRRTSERERRDPKERYDRERYERSDFTTYRREPRTQRGDRTRRKPQPDQGEEHSKPEASEKMSKSKARIERYKNELKDKKVRTERRRHREGEEEWFSSDEARTTKGRLPRRAQTVEGENSEEGRVERPARRTRKPPSLQYYSANPADKIRSSQSAPPKSQETKEKVSRSRSEKTEKSKESKAKKEVSEQKVSETKESGEVKKVKKAEKSKLEMDRLKKMTQSGMDLLTIGIYAVEGKDDQDIAENSDGFVEVVRKKSKKEPEPVEKKAATSKTKKSKKSGSSKKKSGTSQETTVTVNTTTTDKTPTKTWTAANGVDIPLMSNMWRKNAWDKPLTFTEKQTLEAREILAPLSGESTSLFSSDADLAKKTKEKNWRGEGKGPRFSKEKSAPTKTEKQKEEEEDLPPIVTVVDTSPLDLIPPVVEDLFGIRSDGEEDKISSLVLDTPVVGPPRLLEKKEEESSKEVEPSPDQAETSTQTTPPAARPIDDTPTSPLAVKQLITSTSTLSLTDQLREIGQQGDRSHFFAASPLIQSLQSSAAPEPPLMGHFVTPQPTETHIMPSPHQLGVSTNMPLMGSHHPGLSNIVNRPASSDFFKNYISPMSPTNKIHASTQNFVNQNLHQLMSAQFSSANYASPSMSPIPSQLNPFAPFQQKATSPKLQTLYNSPQQSSGVMDPAAMFGQQLSKPAQPTQQQLFYQRMMPGAEMYYSDNILLQSDMSKHVDAKPFNPGAPPTLQPRPGIFKPELLQQAMLQQHKEVINSRPHLVHRPTDIANITNINGMVAHNLQRMPGMENFQLKSSGAQMMRNNMPRVKLARDGRLHRVPDMRNKFSSLIPPAVQQHMQQQSLAQIQQYTAAISRGEDPAKETLPDNMKPPHSPIKHAPIKEPEPPQQPEPEHMEKIIVEEEPQKEEKKVAEKRKHSETVRSTYRRRSYGYPPDYGDQYGYGDERYNSEENYRYRGARNTRYPPPPPMYRGYPPHIPPREYRRPPPRHRY